MAKILIVDDEETIRNLLKSALERKKHEVACADDGIKACTMLKDFQPDAIISDIKMPKLDGFQMAERMKSENASVPPIIYITGHGDKNIAIESLRKGAFDYLEKPFEMDEIFFTLERAIEKYTLSKENKNLTVALQSANEKLAEQLDAKKALVRRIQSSDTAIAPDSSSKELSIEMLGSSAAIQPVRGAIERLSKNSLGSSMSVLITGPSGSGKEIVARMLHELSQRKEAPWVPLNCAAFPENLIESELFGHEKGAFTGATNKKPGVFEMADGGTLFLDEVGELPINLQAKLLRALQEQSFRRVGGTQEIKVNVRVIAATNKDLKKCVENKTFREDLFYRLNSLPIVLPSLKSRGSDEIIRLSKYLLSKITGTSPSNHKTLSESAQQELTTYDWPGNIRELKSVLQRAALLSDEETIEASTIRLAIGNHFAEAIPFPSPTTVNSSVLNANPISSSSISVAGIPYHDWKRSIVMQMEKQYLEEQLKTFHGNVSALSRSMKVTRPNLCRLLKKHKLVAESYRKHNGKEIKHDIAA